MTGRNSCYTYFSIVGDFDPDEISSRLALTPEKTRKIGDLRCDGTAHDSALWEIGRCAQYDVEVGNQMRQTLAPLWDKIPLLNQIREEHDVRFFLEIVPTIDPDGIHPCLAPPLEVIDFCHATRTEMDIDLYICPCAEE